MRVNHSILAVGINTTASEKIRIQKELMKNDIMLDTASIKDIIFSIVDGKVNTYIKGKEIRNYGYVWIQSGWKTTHMAYLLHLCLESEDIQHNMTNIHATKLSDIFFLASKGVLVPNTYFHNSLKIDDGNIGEIEKICGLPCIYKTSLGSLGNNVYLIKEKSEIKSTIRSIGGYNRYVFQEYIPNDFDYRVIIANGLPTSVCIRSRVADEYRNNVALGATEKFINVDSVSPEILKLAVNAAKALSLNWAGIDIVTSKITGVNYVLEVNRRPGLTQNSLETVAAFNYIGTLLEK
ncbi:MAG: SSU ribosomal protein S6P modification protein [candidate division WS6 bacterium GW2011_GWF2_39_15]|uniref:SSU ribosomal protein S6P modification protein n=1 Tax=candidate division WS6 bacterium GW2011_GWF2_39_15 TaxID=1619100 RepID=A0A0G0Q6V3_9BACT|nr:MAG: SSU ribosomal protein S6P modification protein [candidate division WS6 bacterium GW2011_GWF2_39_15]